MTAPPFHASLWQRLIAFLVPGRFGRVVLHVENGRVVRLEVTETFKASDRDG